MERKDMVEERKSNAGIAYASGIYHYNTLLSLTANMH